MNIKIVFLFAAGIIGASLNVFIIWWAASYLHLHYLLSAMLGVVVNMLVNLCAERVYASLQRSILDRPFPKFLTALIATALLNSALLWFAVETVGLKLIPVVVFNILIFSCVNFVLNRAWIFASSVRAEVLYREVSSDFYEDQLNPREVGWFRAWYHRTRYGRLAKFVDDHLKNVTSARIVDLGCGSCNWNTKGWPVVGVDINRGMLEAGARAGRLVEIREAPLDNTGLPDASFDLVVAAEVIEHIANLDAFFREVRRILKPQGLFLITVPYDFFPSPFYVLFNMHCFIRGYLLEDEYYRHRCGHIHHFTKTILRNLAEEYKFRIRRIFIVNGFLIYASAERAERELLG